MKKIAYIFGFFLVVQFFLHNQADAKNSQSATSLFEPGKLQALKCQLAQFPNLQLADLPTPLLPLNNLSKLLGGPKIYLKSDNLTGHGGGGNKLRKLSYVLADAVKKGSTDIITTGATQSNHCRMTASQCARLNLDCHLVLENRRDNYQARHLNSGNVFLDKLFGANIYHFKSGTDTKKEMEALAHKLKKEGRIPYIVPGGASNPLGALGYVEAAIELVEQLNKQNIEANLLVSATGSAGTHAGLAAGLQAIGSSMQLLGISTRDSKQAQEEKVFALTKDIGKKLGIDAVLLKRTFIQANADFIGTGYGEPSAGCIEAINLLARHEGILLDPVYSGKAMAGLISLIRAGYFKPSDSIVFLHTGGEDSLPAYEDYFQF